MILLPRELLAAAGAALTAMAGLLPGLGHHAAVRPAVATRRAGLATASAAPTPPPPATPAQARGLARTMAAGHGWRGAQWTCLDRLWTRESAWRVTADNPASDAYGIPQALPGAKMASAGTRWRTDAATQIEWGLTYVAAAYGTPCAAWGHESSYGWY